MSGSHGSSGHKNTSKKGSKSKKNEGASMQSCAMFKVDAPCLSSDDCLLFPCCNLVQIESVQVLPAV